MQKYLINSVQTSVETHLLSKHAESIGYITHYNWVVCDDEYRGCAVIEADSETEAILSVPPFVRNKAKVRKLTI